jgi:hypothetical protein
MIETMPTGGRLEFVTDASSVEVDVDLTHVRMTAEAGRAAVFDLVIDGDLVDLRTTRAGTTIVADPATAVAERPSAPH